MKLQIYAKGTKLKLTKDWEFECHEEGDSLTPDGFCLLQKGTILSIHDIDIRGNCKTPRSVKFLIPKKGCPSDLRFEQQTFHVDFNQLDTLEFEFASKADKVLNGLDSIVKDIEEELSLNN